MFPKRQANHAIRGPWVGRLVAGVLILLAAALVFFAGREMKTSREQARYISRIAGQLTYQVKPGPSNEIRFPAEGPYDLRLGYSYLPEYVAHATAKGFTIESQARWSRRMIELTDKGLFPVYWEKTRAGLILLGHDGEVLYDAGRPLRIYPDFASIPDLLVRTLLYIENRELLDPGYPYRNPAVEWDRLARSVLQLGINQLDPEHRVTGGSTLATQMEKYRHSEDGLTSSVGEKFRQVATASLRAYRHGEETMVTRQRIVTDYINSVPLGAAPGHGEVFGLGDGVEAWYGADFDRVNRLLSGSTAMSPAEFTGQALALKQLLSLMIAQRRPSFYLVTGLEALQSRTNEYLNVLADGAVISPALRDAAVAQKLTLNPPDPKRRRGNFLEHKAANAVRPRLLSLLEVPQLYDLDRMDLSVNTTLDGRAQKEVAKVLSRLGDPEFLAENNLRGERLLETGDPKSVIYSFTLYENVEDANLLRVQVDNYNQPLNINEGVKLELGSTAKLRTIITYLEIVAELHDAHAGKSRADLRAVQVAPSDKLTAWALDYLGSAADTTIAAMLDAALDRRYSASPTESFFTGGGLHTFSNFKPEDDRRVLTVREGFRNSVNLVFIRMMREIVRYHLARLESLPELLSDGDDPRRMEYLRRFADREGKVFLNRFYRKYKDLEAGPALEVLLDNVTATPTRLAVIHRSVAPQAEFEEFAAFFHDRLPGSTISDSSLKNLYRKFSVAEYSLADRAYLSRIHPLELWTVAYLREHPGAPFTQIVAASEQERQDAYSWLFKVRHKSRQDWRIQTLLELDAFQAIHTRWQRVGYPFESLVPSYATAIGSSADRPAALADLVGIIVNDGMRYQAVRIESMVLGEGTPYETRLRRQRDQGERVLKSEIAAALRPELLGIVEQGTAVRLRGAYRAADGTPIPVGGKTGTGDNRSTSYDSRGNEISSVAINRTSTFVFLIGDRFFGVLTAYVPGAAADDYGFTSSLPVAIMTLLEPALERLILSPEPAPAVAAAGP